MTDENTTAEQDATAEQGDQAERRLEVIGHLSDEVRTLKAQLAEAQASRQRPELITPEEQRERWGREIFDRLTGPSTGAMDQRPM